MPSYPTSRATQQRLEAQFNFMTELTRTSYDAMRQLSALNMQLVQQVMDDSAEASRQLAACRDPVQFATVAANAAQPLVLHLRSYQEQLIGMLTGAQVELTRGAEAFIPEGVRYASAMAQTMVRESAAGGADTLSSMADADGAAGGTPHATRH
ncbi:MAG: TIGR01841 family phasin [Bdellovibrionales bacterium]|nr:TIGR01841 family phasin [Massilia sp.]